MYKDNSTKEVQQLKRYTNTRYLYALLNDKILPFSNPIDNKWDDMNDVKVLDLYRQKIGADKVFAICFSSARETIHLWKSYANDREGYYGCCINFNVEYLMKLFEENKICRRFVNYYEMEDLKKLQISNDMFPFTKRYLYRIEEEYRIIFNDFNNRTKFSLLIDPVKCIKSIVLSPNIIDTEIYKINKKWSALGGNVIKFTHKTTVYQNSKWINHFRNI